MIKKDNIILGGVKSYLAPEENPENFENVLSEYVIAYDNKKGSYCSFAKMKLRRLRNYVFNNIKVDLKSIYYKNVFSP